jgi:hypothetical protein
MGISKQWLKEELQRLKGEIKILKCEHRNVEWQRLYSENGKLSNCYKKTCLKCGFTADYFGSEAIEEMKKYYEGKIKEIQNLTGDQNG